MTTPDTSLSVAHGPFPPDWTIGALLDWIADDDARCHDDAVRPLLESALATAREERGVLPAGTVALVRAVAVLAREHPQLRTLRIRPPAVETPARGSALTSAAA